MTERTPPTDQVLRCESCGRHLQPPGDVLSLLATICPRCAKLGGKQYPDLDPDYGAWFSGLVDGEGCFYISPNFGCRFIINLRGDDLEIIEDIQARLGMGRISHAPRNKKTGRINPHVVYEVARKKDCAQLTLVFDAYPLRTKKARDYAIWRRAVLSHCDGAKASSLAGFKRQLAETRKYQEPNE